MLLDRGRVKFWQRLVFGVMAVIMAGSLVVFTLGDVSGCNGSSSAVEEIDADIARYDAAVQVDAEDVAAWRSLGESYLFRANQREQGSPEEAADWRSAGAAYEQAEKVLAKQKGAEAKRLRLDTLRQLATVYLYLQEFQLATSVYGQITELRPKDSQAYFDMATVALNAGDTNTALLAFTRYLELEPEAPDADAVRDWIEQNAPSSSSPAPGGGGGG